MKESIVREGGRRLLEKVDKVVARVRLLGGGDGIEKWGLDLKKQGVS